MSAVTPAETAAFASSAAAALRVHWPAATQAGAPDSAAMDEIAQDLGLPR